jgi:hypothetical protein
LEVMPLLEVKWGCGREEECGEHKGHKDVSLASLYYIVCRLIARVTSRHGGKPSAAPNVARGGSRRHSRHPIFWQICLETRNQVRSLIRQPEGRPRTRSECPPIIRRSTCLSSFPRAYTVTRYERRPFHGWTFDVTSTLAAAPAPASAHVAVAPPPAAPAAVSGQPAFVSSANIGLRLCWCPRCELPGLGWYKSRHGLNLSRGLCQERVSRLRLQGYVL